MKIKTKRGLTLPELLITSVVTIIIIGAATVIMVMGIRVFKASSETALQQRELRIAETGLKENLLLAQSYDIETHISGQAVNAAAGEICLYFEGSDFVIQTGDTRVATSGLDGVTVYFIEESGFCRAEYIIKTPGLERRGTVVMNNMENANGTEISLLPGASNVLRMAVPIR